MNPALEAAPYAHEHASNDAANRAPRLNQPQANTVIACAQQNHWGKDCCSNTEAQIAKEENKLQPQQTRTLKDVPKTICGFFKIYCPALARLRRFAGVVGCEQKTRRKLPIQRLPHQLTKSR